MNNSFDKAQRAYDAQEPEYVKPCVKCMTLEHFNLKRMVEDSMHNAATATMACVFSHEQERAIESMVEAFESALESYYENDAQPCPEHAPTKGDDD